MLRSEAPRSSALDVAKQRSARKRPAKKRPPQRKPVPRRVEPAPSRDQRAILARLGVILVVVGLVYVLFLRTRAPGEVSAQALAAARAAGCGQVVHPAKSAPGGIHLQPGESYRYTQHPPTSGPHDPVPLPPDPHVYASPLPQTHAVHNLEHAYVLIYYRPSGDGGISTETVGALAGLARSESRVIMAPYPDLPSGTALALAAWNTLWECPAEVTSTQATTIARGFIDAYRGTNIAPEPPRGLLGPILFR